MRMGSTNDKGVVFDIQRFCIHDGPGIRTTVFLKGCFLRCMWCANPEGLSTARELMFYPRKCKNIGRCADVCGPNAITTIPNTKINRSRCTVCEKCVFVCPNDALRVVGKVMSAEEVVEEIMLDEPFYRNSGGGVTLSGGEPMVQVDFVLSILGMCKDNGIHTAVETCGYCRWNEMERLIPWTDLILFDLKIIDDKKHILLTGKSNTLILQNAKELVRVGANVQFRMPIVPACNTDRNNIIRTARFIRMLGKDSIVLLPYHRLGEEKYNWLSIIPPYKHVSPSEKMLRTIGDLFSREGVKADVY